MEEGLRDAYPLETAIVAAGAISMLPARSALGVVDSLAGGAISNAVLHYASKAKIRRAVQSVEEFLGGPGKIIDSKAGDPIFIRGNKRTLNGREGIFQINLS